MKKLPAFIPSAIAISTSILLVMFVTSFQVKAEASLYTTVKCAISFKHYNGSIYTRLESLAARKAIKQSESREGFVKFYEGLHVTYKSLDAEAQFGINQQCQIDLINGDFKEVETRIK